MDDVLVRRDELGDAGVGVLDELLDGVLIRMHHDLGRYLKQVARHRLHRAKSLQTVARGTGGQGFLWDQCGFGGVRLKSGKLLKERAFQ